MYAFALIFDGLDASQLVDMLSTSLATYAYIIGGYHVVLLFAILFKNKEKGFSLPIGSTIITHLACLVLVVGLAVGRHYIPFFRIIMYFIPGLAPFEANWLFSGGKKQAKNILGVESAEPAPNAQTASLINAASNASAADYEEFLKLIHENIRPYRRPGSSLKEEFGRWLEARAKQEARARVSNPTT